MWVVLLLHLQKLLLKGVKILPDSFSWRPRLTPSPEEGGAACSLMVHAGKAELPEQISPRLLLPPPEQHPPQQLWEPSQHLQLNAGCSPPPEHSREGRVTSAHVQPAGLNRPPPDSVQSTDAGKRVGG